MSQLYCTGRVTSALELKTSVKGTHYLRFPIAERVGYGDSVHTQYIQVWAWGAMTQQLVNSKVGQGSVLWVSGSLELEEYTKKDGVTRDKRLKLKLKDWGFVPAGTRRDGPDLTNHVPAPEIIDGDREALPE